MSTGTSESQTKTSTKRGPRTKQERRQIVEEVLVPGTSVAAVAQAHGINTNQVYHWRKLYQQGLLTDDAPAPAWLPVQIADGEPEASRLAATETGTPSAPVPNRDAAGMMHLATSQAQLWIEGPADPATLRTVLEHLLR